MRTIPIFHISFDWHRYYFYLIGGLVLILLLGFAMRYGFQSPQIQEGQARTIIVGETAVYQEPNRFSPKVATLNFGQQVMAFPKQSTQAHGEWTKVQLDKEPLGFVKESSLGTPEIMETFQRLRKSIEGMEPQASGVTTTATNFRLEPGRNTKTIEKLPTGTRFEIFQRHAIQPLRSKDDILMTPLRKEVWYKVQLADKRVGYIFTKNFKLEPPAEISIYTNNRRIMAWQKLRTVTSADFGSVGEYIAAYASLNSDFGADFDRIEGYSWDGKGYQTVFVLKSLRGILPLRVIRQDKEISFEFSELDPENKKQVIVRRYPYGHPFKELGRTVLQGDPGLH